MRLQQTFGPLSLLLFAALFSSSEGFVAPVSRLPSTIAGGEKQDSWILRSETSGTQEQVDVQQVEAWKKIILDEAAGTSNGINATPEQRKAIEEAASWLVARNPTKDIATSDIATGLWDLVYTTSSSTSAGRLGPYIGEVQQEVDVSKGVYFNYVRVGPLTGKLLANWEIMNEKQWKVIFRTITFLLWGRQVVNLDLGREGCWTLSYLDQDMRILTGRPIGKEVGNLYILSRA